MRKSLLLLLVISSVACFEVHPEWREAIRSICLAAESGIYPHPSPDAQRLYGSSDVGAQVCIFLQSHIIPITISFSPAWL